MARIVYASQAAVSGSVYAEMERIRAAAVRHNEPMGVNTALLYQAGWFVQWKEGPGEALLRLMDRVAADPRHHSMRIVHSSRGPRLLAGPWSMAIVQCADDPAHMARRVMHLRRSMEAGLQYAPPAVWRQISTPMEHPGAARQADPDAFQRVLVCSAAGSTSFELVRWLSRQTRQQVVHRRFAGPRDLDVGTDLVDFAEEDRMLRVIAMARKGLALPLTRAFIPDYSHLLLLLCGEADRDLALLHKVALACGGLVSPPVLLGVAQDPAAHAEPFAMAHRLGLIYLQCQANPHDSEAAWAAAHPLLALWREAANSGSPVEAPQRFSPG
ncbi:MAG TPA: BLUF domain-containing protein [Ramlibacter sp.]|nr:BLUF domain-containing protein [Ramlibacter sp.]